MSYNRRTWRMLLTVTTSVVEYSCLHSMFAQHKQGDKRAWFHFNSGLLELNLQLYLDEVCLEFHDSTHAPFSVVHLKWSKDCIIQLARSTCSCALAGSSLVVALKLRNFRVGCPAHVRCNYNFLILLCSSTKIELSVPVPKILSVITIIEDCWWNNKHTNRSRSPLQSLLRLTSWRRLGSELDEEDRAKPISLCAVALKCRDVARVTF